MEPVEDYILDTFETGDKNREELIPVDISSYLGECSPQKFDESTCLDVIHKF